MNIKNKHITDNIIWFYKDSSQEIFDMIYKKNLWGSNESVSGKGSEQNSVKNITANFPKLLKQYNIKSLLDAPCGDFGWMKNLQYEFENYIGVDIVEELIEINKKLYSTNTINFQCKDITKNKFSKFDMILCRDCFIHLPFSKIFLALENFKKSNSTYLLTTTYKTVEKNSDVYIGGFRKIDLMKCPFNFPAPLFEIMEDEFEQKYLSLWRLSDL